MRKTLIFILLISLFSNCVNKSKSNKKGNENSVKSSEVSLINYNVNNYYRHNSNLFTEGLLFNNGILYESTGSPSELPNTESIIGIVNLTSGKIEKKITLNKKKYFGEGITIIDNKIFQLTYRSQIAFIYDAVSFKKIGQFKYKNKEGWGLTTDGQNIIMSDGSNILTYIDPHNYKIIKSLNITEGGCFLNNLNELEYINGYIYANVWQTDYIVKIDTNNGKVVGKLDLTPIASEIRSRYPNSGVMNGIAYNPNSDKIYITGKLWPFIYEIEFAH